METSELIEEWIKKNTEEILTLIRTNLPGWYRSSFNEFLEEAAQDLIEKYTKMENKENISYVVQSYGGEWEDSWESIVGIFTDKEKAIIAAEEEWDRQGNWQSKMKVPFKIYVQNIDNFDYKEYNDELFDEEDEIDYIFHDYLGYTKEEWEESSILYERNYYSSYAWTDIYEYPLNSTIKTYNEKIWSKSTASETTSDWDYEVTDTFDDELV